MFTSEEINTIRKRFSDSKTPEEIASELGMSLTGFRSRLLNSGYRIVVSRQLEVVQPVQIVPAPLISTGA